MCTCVNEHVMCVFMQWEWMKKAVSTCYSPCVAYCMMRPVSKKMLINVRRISIKQWLILKFIWLWICLFVSACIYFVFGHIQAWPSRTWPSLGKDQSSWFNEYKQVIRQGTLCDQGARGTLNETTLLLCWITTVCSWPAVWKQLSHSCVHFWYRMAEMQWLRQWPISKIVCHFSWRPIKVR